MKSFRNKVGENCRYVRLLKICLKRMGKENWVIQGKIVKYGKTVGVFYV